MRFGPSDRTAGGAHPGDATASKPTKGVLMHARMLAIPLLAAAGALPALAAPASADTIASTSAAVSANASSAATLDRHALVSDGAPGKTTITKRGRLRCIYISIHVVVSRSQ